MSLCVLEGEGFQDGVEYADNRLNTGSVSYQTGVADTMPSGWTATVGGGGKGVNETLMEYAFCGSSFIAPADGVITVSAITNCSVSNGTTTISTTGTLTVSKGDTVSISGSVGGATGHGISNYLYCSCTYTYTPD